METDLNPDKVEKDDRIFSYYFVSCFFLACGSVPFYKRAIQRKLLWTVAFFVFFGFLSSLLLTFIAFSETNEIRQEFVQGYDTGEVPVITIEQGIANVEGPQPWISKNDGPVFIVDTTGQITEIDEQKYEEAMLLTKTKIHILRDGQYHVLDIADVQRQFGDPIRIDKQLMLKFWGALFLFIEILVFAALFIWAVVIRFIYIAGIALILWAIISARKKEVGYGPVLIIGLLANVPAIYIRNVLYLFDISFITLYTILLLTIWIFMLVKVYKGKKVVSESIGAESSSRPTQNMGPENPVDTDSPINQ